MEKVRQHAKQVGNISKEMETLRKNKKERLDIKKHCNRNEEHLQWNHRLDTNEERIRELQDMSVQTSQT